MAPLIKLIILALVIIVTGIILVRNNPSFGGKIEGKRLKRLLASPNFRKGRFMNPVPTVMNPSRSLMIRAILAFMRGDKRRSPDGSIPNLPLEIEKISTGHQDNVTWLGHSTLLMRIDGITILTDPVFSKRVAPFTFTGPRAFEYDNPYGIDELPDIDILVITHDHYDHLDYKTILELKENDRVGHFITALGVGAHLNKWGIPEDKVTELDWWESTESNGIVFTATPARHFSGRGMGNRFSTLWASFVMRGKSTNIFIGGDSGYYEGFKEIGKKFGPFDLTILECGQYGEAWPHIHMFPEQTVSAHSDLKGNLLLPVHWGKFSLSLHPWQEPIERLLREAVQTGISVTTPRIGETFSVGAAFPNSHWWRER